jgi:hypothetical protein
MSFCKFLGKEKDRSGLEDSVGPAELRHGQDYPGLSMLTKKLIESRQKCAEGRHFHCPAVKEIGSFLIEHPMSLS